MAKEIGPIMRLDNSFNGLCDFLKSEKTGIFQDELNDLLSLDDELGYTRKKERVEWILEEAHIKIEKKICQKIFDKLKGCSGDYNSIESQLMSKLLKDSSIKPSKVEKILTFGRGDLIYFYFPFNNEDENQDRVDGCAVCVKLTPQRGPLNEEIYKTYDLCCDESELKRMWQNDFYDYNYHRPVVMDPTKKGRMVDDEKRSVASLKAKMKILKSL